MKAQSRIFSETKGTTSTEVATSSEKDRDQTCPDKPKIIPEDAPVESQDYRSLNEDIEPVSPDVFLDPQTENPISSQYCERAEKQTVLRPCNLEVPQEAGGVSSSQDMKSARNGFGTQCTENPPQTPDLNPDH